MVFVLLVSTSALLMQKYMKKDNALKVLLKLYSNSMNKTLVPFIFPHNECNYDMFALLQLLIIIVQMGQETY